MIIERIQVDAFGALADLELRDLGGGLTILHGPNEAGKSTLLAFIRFVLFGFRKSAPRYAPPSGSRHGGRLQLRDAAGRRWVVERMAQRPPQIRSDDGAQVGENALQRLLGQVDESLFRSIFAFSLTELSDFASLSGEEVERRLFSGAITGAGGSAAKAVEELHKRKESLLRPRSREGAINTLLDALERAEETVRQARVDAARYAQLGNEEEAARRRQQELQEHVVAAAAEKNFYRGLHGLWEPWQLYLQAQEALAAVGEAPAIAARDEADLLAAEAAVDAARQQERLAAERAEQAAERIAKIAVQPALEAVDRAVRALTTDLGAQMGRLQELGRMDAELAELRRRLDASMRDAELPPGREEILDASLEARLVLASERLGGLRRKAEDIAQRIPELEGDVAQARVREAEAQGGAASRVADLEAALRASEAAHRAEARLRLELLLALTLAGAGAATALFSHAPGPAAAAALGVAWLVHLPFSAPRRRLRASRADAADLRSRAGLAGDASEAAVHREIERLRLEQGAAASLDGARAVRQDAEGRLQGARDSLERLQEEGRQVEAEALRQLSELGIATRLPLPQLTEAVQRIRQTLSDMARLRSQRLETAALSDDWQQRACGVLREAGEEAALSPAEYPPAVEALAERVRQAVSARAQRALLEEDLQRARERLRGAEAELSEALRVQAEVLSRCAIADSAQWAAQRQLLERWRAADRAVQERLAPIALHLRNPRVREALASGTPAGWTAQADHWEAEEGRLRASFVAAVREVAQTEKLRGELLSSDAIPELQARVESLTTEIRRALGRYAEAALARLLIEETLDRYVRTSQPAVLHLASDVFAQVTAGRYRQVVQSAQGLRVETPQGVLRSPGELSRGTAEQLYLTLRLGLAATYMDGGIALPLVMDDVLVNFDPQRMERILGALGAYAAHPGRQVLLFTCHPSTRDLARAAVPGCRAVELEQVLAPAEAAAALEAPALLAALRSRPGQSLREIADRLGMDVTAVRGEMRRLLEAGLAVPEGRGRGTRYRPVDADA